MVKIETDSNDAMEIKAETESQHDVQSHTGMFGFSDVVLTCSTCCTYPFAL